MTQYALRFWPSVLVIVYSVYIDEPVEVALKIMDIHADEPPYVSFEPAAHIVYETHVLKIDAVL